MMEAETGRGAMVEAVMSPEVDMGGAYPAANFIRASVVQASSIFYNTPATLDKVERLVAEAADLGSQLVVFPEAFVGGYPRGNSFGAVVGSRSAKGREDYRKYHASAIDVPGLPSCILLFGCCNLDSVVQCCNSSPNPKSWKLSLCKGNLIQTVQCVCK
jgi:hypothetical protein